MRAAILLLFLAGQLSPRTEETWGTINFSNLNIPKADGTGTYNVPIFESDPGHGAGSIPGGFVVGLFLPGSIEPVAIDILGTSAATSPFMVTPPPPFPVSLPGYPPGTTPTLTIRAWPPVASQWANSPYYDAEWTITTKPLGGVPLDGGPEIPVPGLTGWGPESGEGFTLHRPLSAIPYTSIEIPANGAVYAAPAAIPISGRAVRYDGFWLPGYYVITNFAVYAGSTLVSTQIPSSIFFTIRTPPLGAGTYTLSSAMQGHFVIYETMMAYPGEPHQSLPVTITVVDPINVSLTQPSIAGGQLTFQYTVNPSLSYVIQHSADLLTWQGIETNKPTSSPALFSRPIASGPPGYYRVERLPNP